MSKYFSRPYPNMPLYSYISVLFTYPVAVRKVVSVRKCLTRFPHQNMLFPFPFIFAPIKETKYRNNFPTSFLVEEILFYF